jgi:uncharacterized protein (DUF433 family)
MATIDQSTVYASQTPEGGWRVAGSRISLDSVVWGYWSGLTPEEIIAQFPSLSAEQVYGAIAFYLANRDEMDVYLEKQRQQWEKLRADTTTRMGPLIERIRARRLDGAKTANQA